NLHSLRPTEGGLTREHLHVALLEILQKPDEIDHRLVSQLLLQTGWHQRLVQARQRLQSLRLTVCAPTPGMFIFRLLPDPEVM
ncbi:MAG TPA: hypothetical protein DGJ56_09720, partial [Verrucomicrobiales bacterium]|nr:hypothetical protein [Verrucomicrobiales bacterium]